MRSLLTAPPSEQQYWARRLITLKEPTARARGVLCIGFDVFGQLAVTHDMAAILRDYHLVLEPSWSGYCAPELLQFLAYPDQAVVVQTPDKLDFAFLQRLDRNLLPIEIGASNWVDHRVFRDLGEAKRYDCIMIAHFGDLKRHQVLFDAMRRIGDPSFRACLVGEPFGGRTRADLELLAAYYGVRSSIDIFERVPPEQVNALLNASKVNVLLSVKEGANRAIFEGLFANVPGIVLAANRGVNKDYVNEHTGCLIDERDLAETLLWFRANAGSIKPRSWAMANIAPEVSTRRLEEVLRDLAASRGEPWEGGLVVKVNRPEFEYFDRTLTPIDLSKYERHDGQHSRT